MHDVAAPPIAHLVQAGQDKGTQLVEARTDRRGVTGQQLLGPDRDRQRELLAGVAQVQRALERARRLLDSLVPLLPPAVRRAGEAAAAEDVRRG